MYTLQGCINYDVFFRKCPNSQCHLEYSGDQDSVFFLSNNTCAGDEIGWDFISMVKNSKISFTAYCNEMTRKYHTTNPLSAPFMSTNTFVKWIFAGMGSMKIDFRKEVDPWCKYEPKLLACDRTHVGVSIKHMKLNNPVTAVDDHSIEVTPVHKS